MLTQKRWLKRQVKWVLKYFELLFFIFRLLKNCDALIDVSNLVLGRHMVQIAIQLKYLCYVPYIKIPIKQFVAQELMLELHSDIALKKAQLYTYKNAKDSFIFNLPYVCGNEVVHRESEFSWKMYKNAKRIKDMLYHENIIK